MTCPFINGDKTKTDCSKKPQVLNNSWNSERGVTVFENAINVWISAGIIPVFSNGNNGPGCGTVNSPADSTVGITVGATDYDDLLAGFSGRGPGLSGEIKPDLTAPGDNVVAPGATSDDNIKVFSGTSFAAPHVAGAIALMLEAFPGLTLSELKSLLYQNTDTSVLSLTSQPTCGALNSASAFPNNAFGFGRVNVLKAINAQKAAVAAASAAAAASSSARSGSVSSGSTAGNVTTPVVGTSSSSHSSSSSSSDSSLSGPGTVNVGDF
jgi:subtilisin family serine protease